MITPMLNPVLIAGKILGRTDVLRFLLQFCPTQHPLEISPLAGPCWPSCALIHVTRSHSHSRMAHRPVVPSLRGPNRPVTLPLTHGRPTGPAPARPDSAWTDPTPRDPDHAPLTIPSRGTATQCSVPTPKYSARSSLNTVAQGESAPRLLAHSLHSTHSHSAPRPRLTSGPGL